MHPAEYESHVCTHGPPDTMHPRGTTEAPATHHTTRAGVAYWDGDPGRVKQSGRRESMVVDGGWINADECGFCCICVNFSSSVVNVIK